jgi:hypothetical protein
MAEEAMSRGVCVHGTELFVADREAGRLACESGEVGELAEKFSGGHRESG